MKQQVENELSIGKILNFHGIKGEVKIGFTEGREKLLKKLKKITIIYNNEPKTLEIESLRFHKQFALIKFKGYNSLDEVLQFKGCLIKVPKELIERYLEKDEFFVSDLVNTEAYDEDNNKLGVIKDVFDIKGESIISLFHNEKEYLIPFVKDYVPIVNLKENKITISNFDRFLEEAD